MPDSQEHLEELRDIGLRQLEATEELLEVQRAVADRQKRALRMFRWLFVPVAAFIALYVIYVVWFNIQAWSR